MRLPLSVITMVCVAVGLVRGLAAEEWTIATDSGEGNEVTIDQTGYYAFAIPSAYYGGYADAKAWDGVTWSNAGGTLVNTGLAYYKVYVTPPNRPCDDEFVSAKVSGSCEVRVWGNANNGTFGCGSATSYAYAAVMGNIDSSLDAGWDSGNNGKCEANATANEGGGWSISVSKDGVGFGVSGSGGVYDKMYSSDIDKEEVLHAKGAFAKVSNRAKAKSAIMNGAEKANAYGSCKNCTASLERLQ